MKSGDTVIMSFSYCKSCEPCERGHPAHCFSFNAIKIEVVPKNFVFKSLAPASESTQAESQTDSSTHAIYGKFFGQSSFARLLIVREDSIVNVSGLISSKEDLALLSPLGCRIQTVSGAIIDAAHANPNDRVAVIGLGGVGLSAAMGARIAACTQIIGIDRHESRLELAKELGARHVIKIDSGADLTDLTKAVKAATGGFGTNITLDTTGVPSLIAEGVKMTAFKGKFLQVGTAPETGTLTIPIHKFMVSGK